MLTMLAMLPVTICYKIVLDRVLLGCIILNINKEKGNKMDDPQDEKYYEYGEYEAIVEEKVQDKCFYSEPLDLLEDVLSWTDEVKLAETLKAMLLAYTHGNDDFLVFAKSFAGACVEGLTEGAEND